MGSTKGRVASGIMVYVKWRPLESGFVTGGASLASAHARPCFVHRDSGQAGKLEGFAWSWVT